MAGVSLDRRAHARAAAMLLVLLSIGGRAALAQMASPDVLPGDNGSLDLPSKQAKPISAGDKPRRELPALGAGILPPGLTNGGGLPVFTSSGVPKPGLTGLTGKEIVVKIKFVGLQTVKEQAARRNVKTIEGRPFNKKTVEDDVRRLTQAGLIGNDVSYQRVGDNGIIVTFHVYERPTIKYIKFYGNKIRRRTLLKECGLKEKEQFLIEAVRDAKTRLEEYYHEKGFNKATVKIIEGDKPNDRGVVFLINEGQKQKVFWVEFEGNKIASDGQLRSKIKSKPPLLYLFKGEVDRQRVEEDVGQIADYYRGLGFFQARVGRELRFNEKQNWLTIRFVIDEGRRSKVRNIKFVGPKIFSQEQLMTDLTLTEGQFYNKAKLDKDKAGLEDKYGAKGYVFAVIQPDITFDEAPGEIDLVYQVEEGSPCVVSRVNIKIHGDNPHTRRNTILNRVSIHPGDLLSTKEVRDSERRLKGSSLFLNTPGEEPKITFDRPDLGGVGGIAEGPGGANGPNGFRGQSPDPETRPRLPQSSYGAGVPPASFYAGATPTPQFRQQPRKGVVSQDKNRQSGTPRGTR